MRQVALIVGLSALACLMGAYPSTSGALSSALDYETADQSLVVKIKKNKDDDDDDDKPKKSKPLNCKKKKCDPGETKLDKPNIYGACCQAGAEPLKHKTTPAEVKCKFPGQVNPPSCDCPPRTEFMGVKGCMPEKKRWNCKQDHADRAGYAIFSYDAVSDGDALIQFRREVEQRKLVMKGPIRCEQVKLD